MRAKLNWFSFKKKIIHLFFIILSQYVVVVLSALGSWSSLYLKRLQFMPNRKILIKVIYGCLFCIFIYSLKGERFLPESKASPQQESIHSPALHVTMCVKAVNDNRKKNKEN